MHPVEIRRRQIGWTVKELAELTGLSRLTISAIENGTSEYKTHQGVALLLAEALDCEVLDLFEPAELSHKGRPPLTGGSPVRVTTTVVEFEVCPWHFTLLPASGICDECS